MRRSKGNLQKETAKLWEFNWSRIPKLPLLDRIGRTEKRKTAARSVPPARCGCFDWPASVSRLIVDFSDSLDDSSLDQATDRRTPMFASASDPERLPAFVGSGHRQLPDVVVFPDLEDSLVMSLIFDESSQLVHGSSASDASGDAGKTAAPDGRLLPTDVTENLVEMFKLLADETRLQILFLLQQKRGTERAVAVPLVEAKPAGGESPLGAAPLGRSDRDAARRQAQLLPPDPPSDSKKSPTWFLPARPAIAIRFGSTTA